MNIPQVSIVIPVFNSEKYLRQCIESILSQSFTEWECILVDDGSTDFSGKICDEYSLKDTRFKVVHKENGGVSSARNKGLEYASGQWICFIDSDDTIQQDFFVEQEVLSDVDIILKDVHFSTNEGVESYGTTGTIEGEALKAFYAKNLPCYAFRTPWAKLIRRGIIIDNNIKYNPAYKLGEDTLFVHECLVWCKKILVSKYGSYIWKPFESGKYAFPFTTAIAYIRDFSKAFFKLDVKCPQLAHDMLIWYSSFTTDFRGLNKIKWYTDPMVNKLYRQAYPLFSNSMRIKIALYSLFALFRNK